MSVAPTLRCPCGERLLRVAALYEAPPAGETRFDFGPQPYRRSYRSCVVCEHWFGDHALDLTALYAREYVDATYGGSQGMERRFAMLMALPVDRSDNRQRVARVRDFAQKRGIGEATRPRLLDVGAGLGVFPAAMAEAGWDALALETDMRAVEHLRSVAGVRALSLDLLTVDAETHGRFDVITFNKVIEHIEDPQPFLAAAAGLLRPHGFTYVEVPDIAAASEGCRREEFFVEHHHVFSPASLAMLGQRAGLSVAAIERLREASGKYTLRMFGTTA